MRFPAAVFAALLFWPLTAHAQNMGGAVGFNNVTNSICGGTCKTVAKQKETFVDRKQVAAGLADPRSVPNAAKSNFTYRYSPKRTQENFRRFIDRTPVEAGRVDLERMIAAQPELMSDLRRGLSLSGLDINDVADAYVLWWINAWLVANKRGDDQDRGLIMKVRQQARAAFAAAPTFENTSDAQRQEFAEALMIQTFILALAFNLSKNNPEAMDQLAQAAVQAGSQMGVDLEAMKLTDQGFLHR